MQHRTGQSGRTRNRPGFTMVELLVVIGIMLVLAAMTIGAINLGVTSERVRSGARQVQSLIEGGRDRAIYAKEARGIRLLVNEQITEDHDLNPATLEIPTVVTSIQYIGSPGQDASAEDRDDVNNNGNVAELRKYVQLPEPTALVAAGVPTTEPLHRAIIGTNTSWTTLYERGLLTANSTIQIEGCTYKIDPRSFPINHESDAVAGPGGYGGTGGNMNGGNPDKPNGSPPPLYNSTNDEILYLLWTDSCLPTPKLNSPTAAPWDTEKLRYSIQLEPDILPNEDPSFLPKNVCIDLASSHLPQSWIKFNTTTGRQFSSKMDILFSPGGGIIGQTGAAGIIHLHVCDVGDAIANTLPGSPTKTDGTPREGDEFGITIYTRSGRVIVHPMDLTGTAYPTLRWTGSNSVGDVVGPTIYNGLYYTLISSSGGSGSNEPVWNTAAGGLTQDGGNVWRGTKHDVWNFGEEGEVAQ